MADDAERTPSDAQARARRGTLFVLWTTYGSFYLCRANFGPARVSLQEALGISAVEMGLVLGAVKLGYAVGQLVNGQLTERFGARRILSVGMVGSAAATLALAATPALAALPGVGGIASPLAAVVASVLAPGAATGSTPVFGVLLSLAFVNGFFQSGGWPPVVKIAGRWFPVAHRGATMGVLGTSLTLGSAVVIALVGLLLSAFGGWRIAFLVPAALLLVSFVHTRLRLKEHPPRGEEGPGVPAHERIPIAEALAATLGNPRVWVLALALFGLDAVRYGFLDWAPGQLADVQHSSAWAAAMKAAVLPLAGAVGALTSGRLSERYFGSRRGPVCAILLAAVGALTLVYRVAVHLGTAPTVLCLALVGFCLFGAQILLVGTAAQDFARRGATAAAAGFVDFMGHVGAFTGDFVTGRVVRSHGWGGALACWAAAAFGAAVLVSTLWRARPTRAE